jgi:hypothetical protein
MAAMNVPVDHIVYGVPDLEAGIADLARRLGARPRAGGRHPGRGTHNALLPLGGRSYLEVIAPDPTQPDPPGPRPFGLDSLTQPRLVGWATPTDRIETLVAQARERGYDPGEIRGMSRERPDGVRLQWNLTQRPWRAAELVVPFLIDWGDSPHPSTDGPDGVRLVLLEAEHPDPATPRAALEALGVALPVRPGPESALIATLETPLGHVVLC